MLKFFVLLLTGDQITSSNSTGKRRVSMWETLSSMTLLEPERNSMSVENALTVVTERLCRNVV